MNYEDFGEYRGLGAMIALDETKRELVRSMENVLDHDTAQLVEELVATLTARGVSRRGALASVRRVLRYGSVK